MKKARIAVFVSGGGTNLEALLQAGEAGQIPHGEFALVCASNEKAYALERAKNHGVPGVAVPKKGMTQEAFEEALNNYLKEYQIDFIILAGFLSILSEEFVKQWEAVSYVPKGFEPNYPEYYTDKGERVRSKSEILIANK